MTLTLFQGLLGIRNINYELCFLDSCFDFCLQSFKCCMVATYIKKIIHNMNRVTEVCSKEMIYMFWVGQVSGLVKNFNIGIFRDTMNLIGVKLCMMVLHIELYLFSSVQVFTQI